jgi:hypothetical protein
MISQASRRAAQRSGQHLRLFRARLPEAVDHAALVAGHFPHGVDVGIAGAKAAVHLNTTWK